jgi:hypothetical protein
MLSAGLRAACKVLGSFDAACESLRGRQVCVKPGNVQSNE